MIIYFSSQLKFVWKIEVIYFKLQIEFLNQLMWTRGRSCWEKLYFITFILVDKIILSTHIEQVYTCRHLRDPSSVVNDYTWYPINRIHVNIFNIFHINSYVSSELVSIFSYMENEKFHLCPHKRKLKCTINSGNMVYHIITIWTIGCTIYYSQ